MWGTIGLDIVVPSSHLVFDVCNLVLLLTVRGVGKMKEEAIKLDEDARTVVTKSEMWRLYWKQRGRRMVEATITLAKVLPGVVGGGRVEEDGRGWIVVVRRVRSTSR